jgi:hypothetical protein
MRLTTREQLAAAVAAGDIGRDARGRYSLADAHESIRTANALTGALSHSSAALHWGWAVKAVPGHPHVTVRRKRHLTTAQRRSIVAHWRDLGDDEVRDNVTSPARTLLDCITGLPFDEALAIADSALRAGSITPSTLVALAARARGGLAHVAQQPGGAPPRLQPLRRTRACRLDRAQVHLGAGDVRAGRGPYLPRGRRAAHRSTGTPCDFQAYASLKRHRACRQAWLREQNRWRIP